MKVLFLTSGSGTTATYLTRLIKEHMNDTQIVHSGFVYEPNENIEACFASLITHEYINHKVFYKVCRAEFAGNEEFHSSIWESIVGLGVDLIMLLGWMHIVPKSFITKCDVAGTKIVNLHPTLQYQLIGRDIYPKIWNMYQDGMIRETGCIVHYVSSELDRGQVIHELRLDLTKCKNYEEYHTAMYGGIQDKDGNNIIGLEKQCAWEALNKLVKAYWADRCDARNITPENGSSSLVLSHRGKVRDIYESQDYPSWLFVQTSDRISANDIVIAYLHGKGALLNQINTFWHRMFGIRQMIQSSAGGLMIVRKMRAIPLEIIIRRRLTGSLWKAYAHRGQRMINGYELLDGMNEGDEFPVPIITPTTKGTHDLPITWNEIVERGILNHKEVGEITKKALDLFINGEAFMKRLGIEMIDTKFEFAFSVDGSLEVIDEIFTPDSSRFIVDGIRMDKDILRKWATDNEAMILAHPTRDDGCRGVELPTTVSERLLANYKGFLDKLLTTQNRDIDQCFGEILQKKNCLVNSLEGLERVVVVIAGSKSDSSHVEKIRAELAKVDILAWVYYSSAHKNTHAVMNILRKYESLAAIGRECKVIYITVAGMSNALSGVVAANTANPVIACPPLVDKGDYQVNINSTLQMPSGVPSACILRPDNVAGFCKRIFRC